MYVCIYYLEAPATAAADVEFNGGGTLRRQPASDSASHLKRLNRTASVEVCFYFYGHTLQ